MGKPIALSAAQSRLGVAEQPLGSNDGPQIAQYRSAVAGSYVASIVRAAHGSHCTTLAKYCATRAKCLLQRLPRAGWALKSAYAIKGVLQLF